MGIKQKKRNRRSVNFYIACLGFREPFKILLDGTFIHNLFVINQITSADYALSNILGAQTKLFTTRCLIKELKSLGDSHFESFQAARNLFSIASCEHENRMTGDKCIEEIIGQRNPEHFFVATLDMGLQKMLRMIPGVPLISGRNNNLFLEQPSTFQREFVKSAENERAKQESKMLQEGARDPSQHEGLEEQSIMTQAAKKTKAARKTMGVIDKPRFKRKRAKGPNPLSCKKKKIHENPSPAPKQNASPPAAPHGE